MTTRIITVTALLMVVTLPLFAASDYFLKIEGVPGESKAPGHEGWIEMSSFSFGVTQPASVGSATTGGKTAVHDLSFTHVVDKASPILMKAALTGQHFPDVTIDLHGQRYLLQDVIVSSFQQAGHGDGNAVPTETVKMQYQHDVTHESTITVRKAGKGQQEFLIAAGKHINNAMFTGGLAGQATVQSLTISGNNSAIIAVCDQTGANGVLIGLRQASLARQKMPELGVVIQGGTQPAEQKKQKADTQQFMQYSFKDATITGFTPAAGGCTQVALNFRSYTGPTTHFDYLK